MLTFAVYMRTKSMPRLSGDWGQKYMFCAITKRMPPEQIALQRCDEYSDKNSLKLEANVRVFATLLKSTTRGTT